MNVLKENQILKKIKYNNKNKKINRPKLLYFVSYFRYKITTNR